MSTGRLKLNFIILGWLKLKPYIMSWNGLTFSIKGEK